VFDVSGAGDTVVAIFAAAIAAGCSHLESVGLANKAAGVVVGKQGTATLTIDELLPSNVLERRIVGRDELAALSASLKAGGKRIVTINGAFDLLHAGHLKILQEARTQGDALIVGLNSDTSVRGHKGPTRPIVGEADRAALLLALRSVDYVHIFDEPIPNAFLEAIRPDVHVNGAEYGEHCVEADTVRRGGGRLHLVERTDGVATSALIERIATTRVQSGS
jgi:D-beta-D-heptose 7-phosphate kinase/D-beta-D-heptose 1-phosphate adenosyltransferase